MAEKKATAKKATETKAAAAKKTTTVKKAAAPKAAAKAVFTVNAENAGFKAGDVYQALAAAGKALAVKEIRLQRFLRRRLFSVSAGSSRRASSLTMERKLHWLNPLTYYKKGR